MTISYDTWRTTPPEDMHPVSRYIPETVTAPLTIDNNEATIDAYATYDAGTGWLISLDIGGEERSVEDVEKALQIIGCDYPRWKQALDSQTLAEKVREAAQDDAEAHGDYLYEQRQDRD